MWSYKHPVPLHGWETEQSVLPVAPQYFMDSSQFLGLKLSVFHLPALQWCLFPRSCLSQVLMPSKSQHANAMPRSLCRMASGFVSQ